MRDRLTELSRARRVGSRVALRSAIWRGQQGPVVRETENAGHLDLLAGSCLMLARTATDAGPSRRGELASGVRELARALGDLADDLGAWDARQGAADRALAVVRGLGHAPPTSDAAIAQVLAMTLTVAADVMTFAGVDAEEAMAAVRRQTGQVDVSEPPPAARHPLTRRGERPWSRVATSALTLVAAASSALRRRRRRR
jgi:hypothetical protein